MADIHKIKPNQVLVRDRQRKEMNKKKFDELVGSIGELGQLQPGLCFIDDKGSTVLIFGERRLRACNQLGIEFSYMLKEEIQDETLLYEIELKENTIREDLPWQDRLDAELKLHEFRQSQHGIAKVGKRGGHGVRDTAEELGKSVGMTQEDLEIAKFARQIEEVRSAPNKTVARNIVRRLKEDVLRREATENALKKAYEVKAKVDATNDSQKKKQPAKEISEEDVFYENLLEYNRRCLLGEIEEVSKGFQKESFDVVIFDPPWNVDYDSVMKNAGNIETYEDSKLNLEDLKEYLELIYELMKPNSHLYMFFGIVNYEYVYSLLDLIGFSCNGIPIIWKKIGAHRTRSPLVWPGRCYEPIAYARKGSKDLVIKGAPDIIETKNLTKTQRKSHPSAKHPDVFKDLLTRSCLPGDCVLDPMAGSGMFGVACDYLKFSLGLDWYQVEKSKSFRALQLTNLDEGYGNIVTKIDDDDHYKDRGPEVPEDYKKLDPGSEEWALYWSLNKDKQDEMLEYRQSLS